MPREPTSSYDKAALVDDLKMAGFEDCIAEQIAARVDAKKESVWTYSMGRQEAIKQAQVLLENSHRALDNFRDASMPVFGQERSLAERIADSTIT